MTENRFSSRELPANQSLLGALGGMITLVAMTLSNGPRGVLVGILVIAGWYLLDATYAVTVGSIGFVALGVPPSLPLSVAGAGGLLVMLFDSLRPLPAARRTSFVFGGALTTLLVFIQWAQSTLDDAWLVALSLVVLASSAAYALHRYETVLVHTQTEETT